MGNICSLSTDDLRVKAREYHHQADRFKPAGPREARFEERNKLYRETNLKMASVFEELIYRREKDSPTRA
jgi:hypothetical protein